MATERAVDQTIQLVRSVERHAEGVIDLLITEVHWGDVAVAVTDLVETCQTLVAFTAKQLARQLEQ